MDNELDIRGEWKNGIPVLEVNYSPSQMFGPQVARQLSERLISEYRDLRSKPPEEQERRACVVVIKAGTAGSPLVRAIFELYKVVSADAATLFCASYPENYMESLTSLGLTALPGFKLTKTLEEALECAAIVSV